MKIAAIRHRTWLIETARVAVVVACATAGAALVSPVASATSTGHAATRAHRGVEVEGAKVANVIRSKSRFTFVLTNRTTNHKHVYAVDYSVTTAFHDCSASTIGIGSVVTVKGYLTGSVIAATYVSVSTTGFGVSGPYVGLKYVGNV